MTKTGKVIFAAGLLAYGIVSLLAIYIALTDGGARRGVPLVAVSAPWSVGMALVSDALLSHPFDGPSKEAWLYGITLTGILLNCVVFWLFVKLTVGRVPKAERGPVPDQPRE